MEEKHMEKSTQWGRDRCIGILLSFVAFLWCFFVVFFYLATYLVEEAESTCTK